MLPSDPTANRNLLDGFDTGPGNTALVPHEGAQTAARGSLSGLPVEIGSYILSFDPDSARVFLAVSRGLQQISAHFLELNKRGIVALYSSEPSSLYNLIHNNAIRFSLLSPPHSLFNLIRFYRSLPESVRSFGIQREECPIRILSSLEIHQFNERLENANLEKVWGPIREQIMETSQQENLARVVYHFFTQVEGTLPEAPPLPEERIAGADARAHETAQEMYRFFSERDPRFHERIREESTPDQEFPENSLDFEILQEALLRTNPQLEGIPEANASAQEIRTWMRAHENQPLLQSITKLNLPRNLTCVPLEITLCTGLQRLGLGQNQLLSLPEEASLRLIPLQHLGLVPHSHARILPCQSSGQNIPMIRSSFNYPGRSPLARLYQLAAGNSSSEEVKELFSRLPDPIRSALFRRIWEEAGSPNVGDPQWGEHHVFDDMQILSTAIASDIMKRFDTLSDDQRNAIYGHVYHLARAERGAEHVNFDDPHWGEHHTLENIPRLIDAMMLLQF